MFFFFFFGALKKNEIYLKVQKNVFEDQNLVEKNL